MRIFSSRCDSDFDAQRFADTLAGVGVASARQAAKSLHCALLEADVENLRADDLRIAAFEIARAGGALDFDTLAASLATRAVTYPTPALLHTRVMRQVLGDPLSVVRSLGAKRAGKRPTPAEALEAATRLALSDDDRRLLRNELAVVEAGSESDSAAAEAARETVASVDEILDEAASISDMIAGLSRVQLTAADVSVGLGASVQYAVYMLVEGARFGIYGPEAQEEQEERDRRTFGGSRVSSVLPPPPPVVEGFSWSKMGKSDVKGAITVGVGAGVATVAGGAIVGGLAGAGVGGAGGFAAAGPPGAAGAAAGGGLAGAGAGALASLPAAGVATVAGAVGGSVAFSLADAVGQLTGWW